MAPKSSNVNSIVICVLIPLSMTMMNLAYEMP